MKTVALAFQYLWSRPLAAMLNLLLLSLGLASFSFVLQVSEQMEHAFERDLALAKAVFGQDDGRGIDDDHARIAVDVSDLAFAGRCGREARVQREHARLGVQLADIDDIRADRAAVHRHLDRLAIGGDGSLAVRFDLIFHRAVSSIPAAFRRSAPSGGIIAQPRESFITT